MPLFALKNAEAAGQRLAEEVPAMHWDVRLRSPPLRRPVLNVLGNRNVRHRPPGNRGFHGLIDHVAHVRRPHHALVIGGDIAEHLHEIHILLIVGADEIVEGVAGDRENRLAVALGIIESIEEMQPTGTGGGQTDAEASGKFGEPAGRKRRRLFMPYLNQLNAALSPAQRFEYAVDTVAGKTEDGVHFPVNQPVDQQICHGVSHR